jgi:hypothetical protein
MSHPGLRRAHYTAGKKAHHKEVDAPLRVKHNLPVVQPKRHWMLEFHRPGGNGIFIHPHKPLTFRGSNEGWADEDIRSFGVYLAGIDRVSIK